MPARWDFSRRRLPLAAKRPAQRRRRCAHGAITLTYTRPGGGRRELSSLRNGGDNDSEQCLQPGITPSSCKGRGLAAANLRRTRIMGQDGSFSTPCRRARTGCPPDRASSRDGHSMSTEIDVLSRAYGRTTRSISRPLARPERIGDSPRRASGRQFLRHRVMVHGLKVHAHFADHQAKNFLSLQMMSVRGRARLRRDAPLAGRSLTAAPACRSRCRRPSSRARTAARPPA